jgi:homeodomain-containing protein
LRPLRRRALAAHTGSFDCQLSDEGLGEEPRTRTRNRSRRYRSRSPSRSRRRSASSRTCPARSFPSTRSSDWGDSDDDVECGDANDEIDLGEGDDEVDSNDGDDVLHGGPMTELGARYDIGRKTGYKWLERFDEGGRQALGDRSRAPHRCPHRISDEMARLICDARRQHPSWGPEKLLQWLAPRHPTLDLPAISTAGDLLARKAW